jgi:hypothetical protein
MHFSNRELPFLLLFWATQLSCGSDSKPEDGAAGNAGASGTSAGNAGSGGQGASGGAAGFGGNAGAAGSAASGGTAGVTAGNGGAGATDAGSAGDAGASSEAGNGSGGEPSLDGDAPITIVGFEVSDAVLLNPERGFYVTGDLADMQDLDGVRADGMTLIYAAAHLDEYLGADHEQDLPQQALDDIASGFSSIRDAGLKAVVRFQYDDGEGYPDGANDASEASILRHIEQLAPILDENRDVIFVLQAGFIGAWGEWHTSLNFTDGTGDQAARKRIVEALMMAAPGVRIGVRYPAYKRMFYGDAATTEAALLAAEPVSLVGHVNDCFVSSEDDVGTYQYEPQDVLMDYLAIDTAYAPIGGETCAEHARNACDVTVPEMERFHYSYINSEYNGAVLDRWASEGCRTEIEARLGYRLALLSASLPHEARPGGTASISFQLENFGFAALTNPRPVILVLSGEGQRYETELPADPRLWLPGGHSFEARVRLPSTLPPGLYSLALFLPDAAENLRDRPEYAVRLANTGLWDESDGKNALVNLTIATDGPGTADPNAGDTLDVLP